MEFILQPWPWYVSGPLIAVVMLSLTYFGKFFGMSSNLRTLCALGGADKFSDFFKFDLKSQRWNLVVVAGVILGGYLGYHHLRYDTPLALSLEVVQDLEDKGFTDVGAHLVPKELFGTQVLNTPKGWAILIIGGFLVGFGARYAGGCTSGHAISGLSNLQLPSLIAVIGFFIGGLIMTYFIFPQLF
ncbi:MAG: YeeE/YedE family protein [Flavobacteriaceae bacterium]|jgi:uncharacterized membrane protein YedE/YeeE